MNIKLCNQKKDEHSFWKFIKKKKRKLFDFIRCKDIFFYIYISCFKDCIRIFQNTLNEHVRLQIPSKEMNVIYENMRVVSMKNI